VEKHSAFRIRRGTRFAAYMPVDYISPAYMPRCGEMLSAPCHAQCALKNYNNLLQETEKIV
jgi:hypothetical protein